MTYDINFPRLCIQVLNLTIWNLGNFFVTVIKLYIYV